MGCCSPNSKNIFTFTDTDADDCELPEKKLVRNNSDKLKMKKGLNLNSKFYFLYIYN